MLDDHRSTHRIVDEARIHESETDRIVRLRELEIEEKEKERSRKGRMVAFIIAVVFIVIGAIIEAVDSYNLLGIFIILGGAYIAMFTFNNADSQKKKREEQRAMHEGMIKLTSTAYEYEGKNYKTIEEIYTRLGFNNISLVNLRDLHFGLSKKDGIVEEVTIDDEVIDCDKWYNPNAEVVITYHGFDK